MLGLNILFPIKVGKCASQLELIAKGDIVGAKRLDSVSPSESIDPEDSDGSHVSCTTVHSGAETDNSEDWNQGWTSLQFTEAMLILNKLLKLKTKACKNCEAKNPKITKPTFGWFHMVIFDTPLLFVAWPLNYYFCQLFLCWNAVVPIFLWNASCLLTVICFFWFHPLQYWDQVIFLVMTHAYRNKISSYTTVYMLLTKNGRNI